MSKVFSLDLNQDKSFHHLLELDCCNFWFCLSCKFQLHNMTKIPNFPKNHALVLVYTNLQYMMYFLDQNQGKCFLHLLELDYCNFWILTSYNYFHKKTKMTKVPNCHHLDTDLQYMMCFLDQNQNRTSLHSKEQDWYNFCVLTSGSYFHRLTKIPNLPIDHLVDTNFQVKYIYGMQCLLKNQMQRKLPKFQPKLHCRQLFSAKESYNSCQPWCWLLAGKSITKQGCDLILNSIN